MEEPDGGGGTRRSQRSGVPRRRMVDNRPRRARGTPVEPVDRWATVKLRELVAMVEPTDRGGVRGLQAGGEAKGFPSLGDMEDGIPTGLTPYR